MRAHKRNKHHHGGLHPFKGAGKDASGLSPLAQTGCPFSRARGCDKESQSANEILAILLHHLQEQMKVLIQTQARHSSQQLLRTEVTQEEGPGPSARRDTATTRDMAAGRTKRDA